jgi:hypothetical protein
LILRVDGSEFAAGIVDLHPPVDAALGTVDVRLPRPGLGFERPNIAEPATSQLPSQA